MPLSLSPSTALANCRQSGSSIAFHSRALHTLPTVHPARSPCPSRQTPPASPSSLKFLDRGAIIDIHCASQSRKFAIGPVALLDGQTQSALSSIESALRCDFSIRRVVLPSATSSPVYPPPNLHADPLPTKMQNNFRLPATFRFLRAARGVLRAAPVAATYCPLRFPTSTPYFPPNPFA